MAALTPEAVWIQETWQLRSIPLQVLVVEPRHNGRELTLTVGAEPSAEKLTLAFAGAAEAQRWCREVQLRQQAAGLAAQGDRHRPEGIALVHQAPKVRYVALDPVEFTGSSQWAADRGLQLRAGMRGADAVIELHRQKYLEGGLAARHGRGLAVRVEDADARKRLRLRWYAEELGALAKRVLLLLVLQAVLLFLLASICARVSAFQEPTGETSSEAIASAGLALGLLYAWPLLLLALLWLLRWPGLLFAVGLATLAATTGRGLTVWLAHLLAVLHSGAPLAKGNLWILIDPFDWFVVIAGVVLCGRACRLARDARQILPPELQAVPTPRKVWSRGLLALTGVYAFAFVGFVGISRYETSSYLLRPGVDPRREHEALLAFNQGAAQAEKGDLDAAEESFQRALGLWEELAARRPAPPYYRANLAQTLYNLGWIRDRRGQLEEAKPYYARAVALADDLAGDPAVDDDFKQTMARAQQALADLRRGTAAKVLEEKEDEAVRKYEEALVKAQNGEVEAEGLYRRAITRWEEVLPHATNEDYRKSAVGRLALAYVRLGELQQQLGKRSAAETSLKQGIDYGEKAVALEPDRPLVKHNLEVARRQLERLREQALQEQVTELCQAERYADAIDLCLRSIHELEDQLRSRLGS
jgi:tetratricopeptide (TPR) repeat protein